ncbi:L-aspartate oxidase [Alteribacillus sp. HJP-4]|uniref:L-aspartate oxidase n=1 Tax=Alteribacillus sp. HJP-4 TaxID=2775394 RepID=UPI0035CCFB86
MDRIISKTDAVIVGSGLAGLMAALQLSKKMNVIVVTKTSLGAGNSEKAQGGIAAAVSKGDNFFLHMKDTLNAGSKFNNQHSVKALLEQSPLVMNELIRLNVPFDKAENGEFHRTREGAHSLRRIFHAGGDATGSNIMKHLKEAVKHQVKIKEHLLIHDVILQGSKSIGVVGKDKEGKVHEIYAPLTILAAGGCGELYSVTSNSKESTGDGVAIAFRAGARIIDMEFIQFHPTMLLTTGETPCLVSEAVRGEGGILVNQEHEPIMEGIHPQKDLAPRSVVAKAVHDEWQKGNKVFLSINRIPHFTKRFPTIAAACKKNSINPAEGMLPVRPGAHFMMGGVAVNEYGETTIPGLFAIGETACTGMHGANRLASNSLLEGAAMALLLADKLSRPSFNASENQAERLDDIEVEVNLPSRIEIQQMMDQYCGIIKNKEELTKLKDWLADYFDVIRAPASHSFSAEGTIIINMLTAAWMITNACLLRTESRGAHLREDFHKEDDSWSSREIVWQGRQMKPIVKEKEYSYESITG